MTRPKVLLGGVPFGCDNIGDEAILACIVNLIRREIPSAHIMACTNAPEKTAELLSIDCTPLYGFDTGENNKSKFQAALRWADIFVWAGATGLSDYPEAGVRCLGLAHAMNVKTVVFCTGMNNSLNPVHVRLSNGIKRSALQMLGFCSGNHFDLVSLYEAQRERRVRWRLKNALDRCELIVNRDASSRDELMRYPLARAPLVGADPAITLQPRKPCEATWGGTLMRFLHAHPRKFGVCISAQQPLKQLDAFVAWLDTQIIRYGAGIVFIPMNPITDTALSQKIQENMVYKDHVIIANASDSPEAVAGLAQEMDLLISSRLHLLIFASITATPCLGIGRGSKVRVFLKQIGQQTVGTTDDLDFAKLDHCVGDILSRPAAYQTAAQIGRADMLKRLDQVTRIFTETILHAAYPRSEVTSRLQTAMAEVQS